jgi:hypothetical protein
MDAVQFEYVAGLGVTVMVARFEVLILSFEGSRVNSVIGLRDISTC